MGHFLLVWILYYINTYILLGGIILNNTNNFDMAKMMEMLSKMDKKDLEAGLAKANKILQNKDKNEILNQISKNK